MFLIYRLAGLIIDLASLALVFFLSLRIFFRLFSANPASPFVAWIYSVSSSLINPFQGIFRSFTISGTGVIDVTAIVALIIYAIIIQLIAYVFKAVLFIPKDARHREYQHYT